MVVGELLHSMRVGSPERDSECQLDSGCSQGQIARKFRKCFSPNFVFVEIFKHKDKILKYTKSSEVEVYEYLNEILKRIHFVSEEIISKDNRQRTYELCVDIDEKDIPIIHRV